nr:glycosyl hydrolase family 65 protein [uncultured Pseudomonas sp.]
MADKAARQIGFSHYDPADERRREALLALGNGRLCWRASAPEAAAPQAERDLHYAGLYRAGWYDEAPRQVNGETVAVAALVRLPDPFGLSISVDGGEHWFYPHPATLLGYRQCLDLESGLLLRDIRFTLGGHDLHLREERFLSMANPHLAVLRWELQVPPAIVSLRVRSVLDGEVENCLVQRNRAYEGRRLQRLAIEHNGHGCATLSASLSDPARYMAMAVVTHIDGSQGDWTTCLDGARLQQEVDCRPDASGRLKIEKRVLIKHERELPADSTAARQQIAQQLPDSSFASLLDQHQRAWRRLWVCLPLRVSSPAVERALHLHAFHLLQSLAQNSRGQDLGFPPRGWQEGYYGQVFWDEIFAVALLATHLPALARELLGYRYRRLDVARERARRAGLRGAMFPWRSARSGEEETPPFQCNPLSGCWIPDHTHLQRHIGATVAFDAWQLYLATGEEALLAGQVGELIVEVARFWASIASYDEARARHVICGVIGPDEYHNVYPHAARPGLDNNAYTNLMAAWTLRQALEVLEVLPPVRAEALCARLGIEQAERQQWEHISRTLYLPISEDGLLSQFDGFERLQAAPAGWLRDQQPRLDWWLEARGDSCDRYQVSKQADVLMLLYLFPPAQLHSLLERLGYPLDEAALKRTLTYHLAHLSHESSLSRVVCAGALAQFDAAASWAYFQQSLQVDLDAPAHSGTIEGVHLGAMAGSLDVLQRHYLGLWPAHDGLHVQPRAPAALGDVDWQLHYRGARLRVHLTGETLRIAADVGNLNHCLIRHGGGRAWLRPGETLELPCPRA